MFKTIKRAVVLTNAQNAFDIIAPNVNGSMADKAVARELLSETVQGFYHNRESEKILKTYSSEVKTYFLLVKSAYRAYEEDFDVSAVILACVAMAQAVRLSNIPNHSLNDVAGIEVATMELAGITEYYADQIRD